MSAVESDVLISTLVWEGDGCQAVSLEPSIPSGSDSPIKRCTKCQLEQRLDEFWNCKQSKDGLSCWCKACFREHKKRPREGTETGDDEVGPAENRDSLYIMENSMLPGMVKIGRSACPEERAKQLAASHPFRIVVQYSYGEKGFLEKTVHDRLKHRRVEGGLGREWFRLTAEQADLLVRASILEHQISP